MLMGANIMQSDVMQSDARRKALESLANVPGKPLIKDQPGRLRGYAPSGAGAAIRGWAFPIAGPLPPGGNSVSTPTPGFRREIPRVPVCRSILGLGKKKNRNPATDHGGWGE